MATMGMGWQGWTTTALLAMALALGTLVAGCSKRDGGATAASAPAGDEASMVQIPEAGFVAPKSVQGVANRDGSKLAYEHEVHVRTDAANIQRAVAAAREACVAARFGKCEVLSEDAAAGEFPSGSLKVRAVPEAIGPLVDLAAKGGEIAQRSTRAEDLADAVRDNGLLTARLRLQHDKLASFLERNDLKPVDLFAITERMAELEAQLQVAEQQAAQHERRIQTNLLTIQFESRGVTAESSRIGEALRGMTSTWDTSIATLIAVVGALLPFFLIAALGYGLVRLVRGRRAPRANPPPKP